MRPLASEHRCGTAATADYIAFHAAERPDAVAIVDRGREIAYAQFHRDLGRFVGAVGELGLARGRAVAVAWGELYPHWLLLLAPERHHALTPEWLARVFARAEAELPVAAAGHPDDPLRIVRTSGTTGEPKRLLLTRRMCEAWLERRIWSLGLTRTSRTLVNMPFTVTGCYTLAT